MEISQMKVYLNKCIKNMAILTFVMPMLVCAANDVSFDQKESLGEPISSLDLNAISNIDKLLDVRPNLIDEYIQLQRDIKTLTAVLLVKEGTHSEEFQKFNEYQKLISNKYNPNQIFNLFRQLDVQSHQQDITDNEYDLNRLKLKLYTAQVRYQQVEIEVEQAYLTKYAVDDKELTNGLLANEALLIKDDQQKVVFNLLKSYENNPRTFAQILSHPSVVALLPDYLKEQLNIFKEANISLVQALNKPEVMKAVISKVNAIDFSPAQLEDDVNKSIYSEQQVPKILNSIVMPIYISSDLDADTVNPVEAIELYDLPLPSQELVFLLASIRENNTTSVYSSLSDYSLDQIVDWDGLEPTYTVASQSEYLTALNNAHGPENLDISEVLPDSLTATFNGEMQGQLMDGSGVVSGDISLDVNFSGNSNTQIEGNFTLNTDQSAINGVIPSTLISGPENFELNFTTDSQQQGGFNGSFFGPNAEEMGGVWVLGNDIDGFNGALGRFRAKR